MYSTSPAFYPVVNTPSNWLLRVCVPLCCSVVDHFNNRAYVLLDESLTWAEARARCSEGNNGYLAVANNAEQFDFLRGMLDKYRSQGGAANGAWIDGRLYEPATAEWVCDAYVYGSNYYCQPGMPWTHGEPSNLDFEHCILVWFNKTDGVSNYVCNEKMPAICATFRYGVHVN